MILSDPLALRSIHLLATANSCHKPAKSIWLFIDDDVIHFASNSPQNMILIYSQDHCATADSKVPFEPPVCLKRISVAQHFSTRVFCPGMDADLLLRNLMKACFVVWALFAETTEHTASSTEAVWLCFC